MRASRPILAGVIAGSITLVVAALLLWHALGGGLEVIAPTPICPGPAYAPLGLPAGQQLGAEAITPRNDCTPSFTVQDVLAYEQAHPFANHRMQSVGQPKVTKVLFITSAQASQRLEGESIGLPDDALVCFVELYGTYRFYPPPLGGGGGGVTEQTGTMHEIFDAHTGNLLVSGG